MTLGALMRALWAAQPTDHLERTVRIGSRAACKKKKKPGVR